MGKKKFYGVGYIGEGDYKPYSNNTKSRYYARWQAMLQRCYDEKYQSRQKTYIGCTVAEEWHNFQNFAKWYDENYYEVEGERMNLDKDILYRNNKLYSPNTCIFVPQSINRLFTKRQSNRGDLPIGVHYHKRDKRYYAQCNNGDGKVEFLGSFDTPQEAFTSYKIFKEALIKKVAEKYKNIIPIQLHYALMNYEVHIDD